MATRCPLVCVTYHPPPPPPTPNPYPHPIPHPTPIHYSDVIMCAIASQITSLAMVCSTLYASADQRKHQSCASLAFVRGIRRGPVNFITATSRHKCTIANQTFLFIRLNSAISVLLWPLRHGGFSGCWLKWTFGAELETENLKGFPRLPILDHCAVTTARTRAVLHIPTDKYILALLLIKNIVEILHFHILPTGFLAPGFKYHGHVNVLIGTRGTELCNRSMTSCDMILSMLLQKICIAATC